jgi:hypothetical protein
MRNRKILLLGLILPFVLVSVQCSTKPYRYFESGPAEQVKISRIEQMPNMPEPYKMRDWKEVTRKYDEYVFDFTAEGKYLPLIWIDGSRHNFEQETFGIYTAIGDVRFGPDAYNGEFHEALNGIGAVLGASLVGIDKSDQHGYNFVRMLENYFNSDNGWNIVMNNTHPDVGGFGGGYSWDFWYDVYPNVLFYAVGSLYPGVHEYENIMRSIADQFYKADSVLGDNYGWSSFNFADMTPQDNGRFKQEDASAGFAWILYMAYMKYGDPRYLEGARSAMEVLQNQKESRFWEILMPFGAYTAARMNAEQGDEHEITKIIDWTFDGTATNRKGWGVIAERMGEFDVHGMVGSTTHGYGFLMNTFDLAWPLVPMVRYDQSYARAVGKWLLNAASTARLFYPFEIPDKHQMLADQKDVTRNVIGYEGLRRTCKYDDPDFDGITPVALGDGPNWNKDNPEVSMFSLYGSSHVGIYGGIIKKTNVEKILQLDCLATDFFSEDAYPTYLYFNPYREMKEVEIELDDASYDIYDIVSRTRVARNVTGKSTIGIEPDNAAVIVITPANGEISIENNKMFINGIVVDYNL